ncbi:MAG: PQQ-dependent sugar dehydrogenase [Pseudomonadales bacterium]
MIRNVFKAAFVFVAIVLAGVTYRFVAWLPAVNTPAGGIIASLVPFLREERPELTLDLLRARISLPPGFGMTVFATDIVGARVLRMTRGGDLLVSSPPTGQVFLLERDRDGDGAADGQRVLLDELKAPHGLDFHLDWLYVGERDAIGRVAFDHARGRVIGTYERIVTDMATGAGGHSKKPIRFGPDGLLYVNVGSTCNLCIEEDPRSAAILRYTPDGKREEIFATGLRNSAGFDWSPRDGKLYGTDNGRDLLGDDFPPCELNEIRQGEFYGWPFANGDRIADPDLGEGRDAEISRSISPVHEFRAHNAPLGIAFLRGDWVPGDYRGAAIVALHGSWNRSRKGGYKVVSLHWRADGSIEERDFMTGFLRDEHVIGRPAEVAEGNDGALYIADDYAGAVYRVVYGRGQDVLGGAEFSAGEVARYAREELDPALIEQAMIAGVEQFRTLGCDACHADSAVSAENLVVLGGLGRSYSVQSLASYLAAPRAPMPAADLSDEARRELAIFLLETYP